MDDNGTQSEDQNLILQVFSKEFTKKIKKDPNVNMRLAIPLSRYILDTKNDQLTQEIEMEEVWQAVNKLAP